MKKVTPYIPGDVADASKRAGIEAVIVRILSLEPANKALFSGFVLGEGLMLMRGINALAYGLFARLVAKMKGLSPAQVYMNTHLIMVKRERLDIIADSIAQTIAHMRHGKDREDKNSAGGFSQRELQLVTNVLAILESGYGAELMRTPSVAYGVVNA